jgi:hypothetical protein
VTQCRAPSSRRAYFALAMADRRIPLNERKPTVLASAPAREATPRPAPTSRPERPAGAAEASARRPASKFGAATDGWDAYNSWLDRVRQPTPPSRQAVIAKSLYSVSSYKTWADKARGAFEGPLPAGNAGGKPGK